MGSKRNQAAKPKGPRYQHCALRILKASSHRCMWHAWHSDVCGYVLHPFLRFDVPFDVRRYCSLKRIGIRGQVFLNPVTIDTFTTAQAPPIMVQKLTTTPPVALLKMLTVKATQAYPPQFAFLYEETEPLTRSYLPKIVPLVTGKAGLKT
ncbi:hypothetical protein STEG23_024706, partial [Scotinomys teguina]